MALDTTIGSATADSYATLAQANAWHTSRGATDWTGSDADKEAALRRATSWIDGRYRAMFPGIHAFPRVQAREWPRTGAYDLAGYALAYDAIPREIIEATCEAALRELQVPFSLTPDYVATSSIKRIRTMGGSQIEKEIEYVGASGVGSVQPILTSVDEILSRLLRRRSSGASVKLVRV